MIVIAIFVFGSRKGFFFATQLLFIFVSSVKSAQICVMTQREADVYGECRPVPGAVGGQCMESSSTPPC